MNKHITADKLRSKYIAFFKSKGHTEISGKSVIPENDPTVLFTTAGMHPLVPYLMGEPHPAGTRLTDYQKCIRTGDIDAVGDASHLTFFEMLGNWSLGDYFKKEAIGFSFEFLTSPQYLNIPVDLLSVTVFAGDDKVPRDTESAEIWEKHGIPKERIHFLPREDNWWGPAGETGPCGPDTEMFIDTGKPACGAKCRPGCSCGKYVEIWNDVFMQYRKEQDGSYHTLERHCVDTGMGIERTVAMLQGKKSVYDTEVFQPIIHSIEKLTGKKYGDNEADDASIRIICDHTRAAVFIIVFSVPLGITAALNKGRFADRLIGFFSFVSFSVPGYFAGLLCLRYFGMYLHWFPVIGHGHIVSVLFAAFVLALPMIGMLTRLLRSFLLENEDKEYIQYAKARGIGSRHIMTRHLLRNAAPVLLTLWGQNIGYLIAGTAITESIFSIPGIGIYALNAAINRDFPVINAYLVLTAFAFVVCNGAAEFLGAALNPLLRNRA